MKKITGRNFIKTIAVGGAALGPNQVVPDFASKLPHNILGPRSTDMVTANIMGFQPEEIPTFVWAWKAGMTPVRLDEIEVRGVRVSDVRQKFLKPTVVPWSTIKEYGPPC
jgi:hypothetical protein